MLYVSNLALLLVIVLNLFDFIPKAQLSIFQLFQPDLIVAEELRGLLQLVIKSWGFNSIPLSQILKLPLRIGKLFVITGRLIALTNDCTFQLL